MPPASITAKLSDINTFLNLSAILGFLYRRQTFFGGIKNIIEQQTNKQNASENGRNHKAIFGVATISIADYGYQQDETKQHDGRWVQRIPITEDAIAQSRSPDTAQFKIAKGLEHLIKIRQQHKIFGQGETHILETDNQHVFAYARHDEQGNALLAMCNFSENPQSVDGKILAHVGFAQSIDLISQKKYSSSQATLKLTPYQVIWLSN